MQDNFTIKEIYDLNTSEKYWCNSIKFNTQNSNFCCLFETIDINDLMLFSINPLKFLAKIKLKNQRILFFTFLNKSLSLILGLNDSQIAIYRLQNGNLENEQIIQLASQEINSIIVNQEDTQFFVSQPLYISCFYYDKQLQQWICYQHLNKQEKNMEQPNNFMNLSDCINKRSFISINSSENQLIINSQNYHSLYQLQGWNRWKLMSHHKNNGQLQFLKDNIQLILNNCKLTIIQVNFRRRSLIRSFYLHMNHFIANSEFQFDQKQQILIFEYDNDSLGIITILKNDQFCQFKILRYYEFFFKKSISSNLKIMVACDFGDAQQIKVLVNEENKSKINEIIYYTL